MCLAVPGKIETISDSPLITGKVNFGGIQKDVALVYVPGAKVGDYVIVHVGFAITLLNEKEAGRIFETLRQIKELEEGDS
ncbi:MAG: HypC/HybG/HupF family hydrogenase formation chaperone [Nitrospirae bacterium]|nr:HypC/HybG/HupF family hydrogenase formation chaperone [Nitrospirota bacterium]